MVKCLFAFGNGAGVVYSLQQFAGHVCVATAHCSETGDEVARQAAIYKYEKVDVLPIRIVKSNGSSR